MSSGASPLIFFLPIFSGVRCFATGRRWTQKRQPSASSELYRSRDVRNAACCGLCYAGAPRGQCQPFALTGNGFISFQLRMGDCCIKWGRRNAFSVPSRTKGLHGSLPSVRRGKSPGAAQKGRSIPAGPGAGGAEPPWGTGRDGSAAGAGRGGEIPRIPRPPCRETPR